MSALIYVMIFLGSCLMVYNIVRYVSFIRMMVHSKNWSGPHVVLQIPFVLLVFFLIGYVAVGLFGKPDIVIAGILLGGSVFVSIILWVIFQIFGRMEESSNRTASLYDELKRGLDTLSHEYAAVFEVNLTKDRIEERMGKGIYETYREARTYTEFIDNLLRHVVGTTDEGGDLILLTRRGLLRCYESGRVAVDKTMLCRTEDGNKCFVRLETRLAMQPGAGDVMAFVTETMCNDALVTETILNKALIEQYDMICYLMDGAYRVVIGEGERIGRGSLFPHEREGTYDEYLRERVGPVLHGTPEERTDAIEALSMASVEEALTQREPYEVNISCDIDGSLFHKRFIYYVIDRGAHFYLLMKSDTTAVRSEEMKRAEVLTEALEEAEHASELKTSFLSNMSHDIRTPMNAIVGYTEFARRCDDFEQTQAYLEKIDASSKYMLALINDVLEMSRIESGRMDLEPEPCDLVEMMGDVRDMFQTQMDAKHVSFVVDTSHVADKSVQCDTVRLNRVLLNLLSNAYKFTPEGGSVRVTLRQLGEAAEGRATYELTVSDTGIGMSEEFAARVFDAFERERTTTASGIQGTGLGMAITKRVVDMMGGSIVVQSKEGEGTTFVVTLPFELSDGQDEPAVTDQERDAEPVDLEGLRILLAEDNEINREIAILLLEELGFEVEAVVNGQEAVDALVKAGPGHFDIVVTDIQMPVLNGLDEARTIRALDDRELARIPIVAMSANAFQEDVRAAYDAGIDGYTAKPIDVGALLDELERVMHAKKG